LDRFLMEYFEKENKRLKEINKEEIDYKKFLISGQDGAFDYKVKIEPHDTKIMPIEYHKKRWDREQRKNIPHYNKSKEKIYTTLPTFFANMGDGWHEKKLQLIYTHDIIDIQIITFFTELKEIIKVNFEKFIFGQTFGARQSKGFGSFTVEKINGVSVEGYEFGDFKFEVDFDAAMNNHSKAKCNKYVDTPDDEFIKFFELFNTIHRFHQTLRSGINEKIYMKPWIFDYAKSQNVQWDKKTFKQIFLNEKCRSEQEEHHKSTSDYPLAYFANEPYYLIRDLLGLSTEQPWRMRPKYSQSCDYGFTVRHPKEKNNIPTDKYPAGHKKGRKIPLNTIKRFKSPIIYKPIKLTDNKYSIYIILNELPREIFDEHFEIIQEKNKKILSVTEPLKMWPNFNIYNFFNYIVDNKEDISNMIKTKKNNDSTKKLIEDMYTSLEGITNA